MTHGDAQRLLCHQLRPRDEKLAIAWEHFWEQNSVKLPQISATGCNPSNTWTRLTWAVATMRPTRNAR